MLRRDSLRCVAIGAGQAIAGTTAAQDEHEQQAADNRHDERADAAESR